ncbi:peptidylprolyl isomerase [Patescibacteria group bacterium]
MKRVFLSVLMLVVISGCTTGNSKVTSKDNTNQSNYKEEDVINRINELKDGKKPMEKSSKNTNQNNPQTNEVKLEDLVSKYKKAIIKTNHGDITVAFYTDDSPLTVNNFLNLANDGFYNGTRFHRIIKDFMIQGGDPLSKEETKRAMWGTGGPGYKFADEFNNHKLVKGSLAMANSGPNTNGSQFFIVTVDATPWLDGKHTNFGYVTDGMKVAEKIENLDTNDPNQEAIIESIKLIE